jgi:catechol 2,3-dioxygenase-like lactoylglutathione lyase family enzyme
VEEKRMKMHELITGLRHIGVIVKDAEKSMNLFKHLLDVEDKDIKVVSTEVTRGESVFSFIPAGGIELELIQPISEHFAKLVGNPPEGINHLAFTVKDLGAAVALMQEKGVRLGHVTRDGILDMGRSRVAYFNPEDTGGILIEFVEPVEKG